MGGKREGYLTSFSSMIVILNFRSVSLKELLWFERFISSSKLVTRSANSETDCDTNDPNKCSEIISLIALFRLSSIKEDFRVSLGMVCVRVLSIEFVLG